MNRILFIIQSYPSEKSANTYCDEKIIRYLIQSGNYEVHCLCTRYNGQPNYEKLDDVHVHRWKRGVFWNIFTWAVHNESDWKSKLIYRIQRFLIRFKQAIMIPVYPIYEPIACIKCANAAKQLCKKYKFDAVWADYFGLETLLAGYAVKKKYSQIHFVPVFWDALSGGLGAGYLPKGFTLSRMKKLEKKVFEIADMPIVLKSHEEHLKKIWKTADFVQKIKYLDIPRFDSAIRNSFDNSAGKFDKNKINIVFAGNMGLRDPEYVLKLLSVHNNKNNIVVWFFTSRKYEDTILRISLRYNIDVKVMGYVAHNILESYLYDADIFLNLGVDTDCLIPSKIFEYMSYGKMILSTYINEKDPCIQYFNHYPGAVQIREGILRGKMEEDLISIESMLKMAKGFSFDCSKLEEMFYLNMPKAYYDAIEGLVATNQ